ncbi:MAG TPA: hypothetical protein VF183_05715 [Acidimicrobiales bacterium]
MALTFIAIVLLAAAWAALLLPDLRGRGSSRRSDSIKNFSRQLSTIERTRPGNRPSARVVAFPHRGVAPVAGVRHGVAPRSVAPRSSAQARQRRRNVLLALLALSVLSLAAGVIVTPLFFVVHVVADVALGGFVWLLVEHRNRTYERRTRAEMRRVPEPVVMPRRRASGS